MNWATIFSWWFLAALIWSLMLSFDMSMDSNSFVDRNVQYIWSKYVAEAWIQKKLLELKSQDVDLVENFSELYKNGSDKNNQYWFLNESADTWYFGLTLNSSPSSSLDLGKIVWGDISFSYLDSEDFFNSFELNYNIDSTEEILLKILTSDESDNFSKCDFELSTELTCDLTQTVVSTADSTFDGHFLNNFRFYFESWEGEYKNKVRIEWFSENKNYKISFATLSSNPTDFNYNTLYNWVNKVVANNLIEIESIWNAIDSFSKSKISKRITNDIQDINKYSIFSNNNIEK